MTDEGWVSGAAGYLLVAVVGEDIVGRVSIRHELNDFLSEAGGHIGDCVGPAYRRRGYASEIFRQALIVARAEGVDRVLVTCDEGNVASAKVIERHGGVLANLCAGLDRPLKRRYWID